MHTMRISLLFVVLLYGQAPVAAQQMGKKGMGVQPAPDAVAIAPNKCNEVERKRALREHDCVGVVYATDDYSGDCDLLTHGKHFVGDLKKGKVGSLTVDGTCALTVASKGEHSASTSTFFPGKHDRGHHPILKVLDDDDTIVIAEVHGGARGLELPVAAGLFCSALLLPTVYLLCAHKKTALWSWPILDNVISGLLSLLWFSIYKSQWASSAWNGADKYGWVELLVRYVGVFLAACILFQKLELKNRDWLHNATTLINPNLNAFAGGIAMSVLFSFKPGTVEEAVVACVKLYAGEAVIIVVMHLVMTHIGGSKRDHNDTEAHLPGEHDQEAAKKDGEWQTAAESVLWGSLAGTVATSLTCLAHFAIVGPKFLKNDDKHAWNGEDDCRFWTVSLVVLTLFGPLLKNFLADRVSAKGIAGKFKVLAPNVVGKSAGFCLLNVIRHGVLVLVFPGQPPIFGALIVSFSASFLVASMGGAMAFPFVRANLNPEIRHFVRANLLTEAAATAGTSWGKVYGASVESGVLQNTTERLVFAVVMSAVVGTVYFTFIKPMVKQVMQEHQKEEKKKAKAKAS